MEQRHKRFLPHVSAALLAAAMSFTQPFEGTAHNAYQHPGDVPTICSGHTSGVHLGDVANDATCARFLSDDEAAALYEVEADIEVPISDKVKVAFADFVFNDGSGNFRKSSMVRYANNDDMPRACHALLAWDMAAGKHVRGIQRRREAEYHLCLEGI